MKTLVITSILGFWKLEKSRLINNTFPFKSYFEERLLEIN